MGVSDFLKRRLSRYRTSSRVLVSMPDDVIDELKLIANTLEVDSIEALIRYYVGRGVREARASTDAASSTSGFDVNRALRSLVSVILLDNGERYDTLGAEVAIEQALAKVCNERLDAKKNIDLGFFMAVGLLARSASRDAQAVRDLVLRGGSLSGPAFRVFANEIGLPEKDTDAIVACLDDAEDFS